MIDVINRLLNLAYKKVLIIGDAMLDYYVEVSPGRISTEYSGLVYNSSDSYYSLGGAANVAANIAGYGVDVDLFSIVGKDSEEKIFFDLLEKYKINNRFILSLKDYRTIVKTRLYSKDNKQIVRFDKEVDTISEYSAVMAMLELIKANAYDIVIISDYQKGLISDSLLNEVIEYSKEKNTYILCDPKSAKVNYHNMWLLKPNKKEMTSLLNADGLTSTQEIIEYKRKKNINNLVITLGEEGIILFDENENITKLGSNSLKVYDVTGAGDVVLAYLALATLAEIDLIEAINIANIAAEVKVAKYRTKPIPLEDIIDRISEYSSNKLVKRENIGQVVNVLRRKKQKIVFTNGCFDILHAGHIHLLSQCKMHGDVLILGLNSDDSIRRIKGKSRPINELCDRIDVLSAIRFVDYIVVFDEDTPYDLIEEIKPEILVKGRDYFGKEIVGADIVKQNNGKVVLVDLLQGRGTSAIVDKIGDRNSDYIK